MSRPSICGRHRAANNTGFFANKVSSWWLNKGRIMTPKILLCLALVLSGSFIVSLADETNAATSTNLSVVKIVNPQGSVDLPKLGQAIFREQSSNLSLQVP